MKQSILIILAAFVLCCSITRVAAHNHLITPTPREGGGTYSIDNNCENNNQGVPGQNNYQRGQRVNVKWSYNNHRGGFVRWSLVPMGQENQGGIFNRPENFIQMGCHTKTCGGSKAGFDSGDKFPCTSTLTIPTHLKDGNYVLQWIVYSMRDSDGIGEKGLPNYLNCANIKVNGGPTGGAPSRCGFDWQGGDREYEWFGGNWPKDSCQYFMKNTLGKAWDTVKVDKNLIKGGGRPKEVEDCMREGGLGQGKGAAAPAPAAPANNGGAANNGDSQEGGQNSVGKGCTRHYVAQQGDSCDSIGRKTNTPGDKVRELNDFVNCNDIWSGTTLCVEPQGGNGGNNGGNSRAQNGGSNSWNRGCSRHIVANQGDNCDAIARDAGISADRVRQLNDQVNCGDIWAGTTLCVDN